MASSSYAVDLATGANLSVAGSVAAGNLPFMRNKVINGDMRIDQRNAGAPTGVTGYGVDRFKTVSTYGVGGVVQQQVALTPEDAAATGGQTFAVKLTSRGLSSGLAVYLPFDGSTADCSESKVTTTMTGAARYVDGALGANGGQALYLANEASVMASTAVTNYIVSTYTFPSAYTISMWAYPTIIKSSVPNNLLYTTATSGTTGTVLLYINGANWLAGFGGGSSTSSVASSAATVNTWAFLTITLLSGSLSLFVNGTLAGTITGTPTSSGFIIGANGTSGTNPFAGYIDDFRIYNRVLSASEIAALYANSLHAALPSPTLSLPFEGTAGATLANGTTIVDATGAYTATVTTSGSPAASYVASGYVVGSTTALYLANEANVLAAPSHASRYLTVPFTQSTPLTVSCWVLFTKMPFSAQTCMPWTIGSASSFGLFLGADYVSTATANLRVGINTIGNTAMTAVSINTWYHCVGTYTPSTRFEFYLNGACVGINITNVPATLANNGQLTLGDGGSTNTANSPFAGYIDDFRVYNSALSAAQVATLYGQTAPVYALWQQPIEAQNTADLAWGTAAAQPATLSCWVKNNTAAAQRFALSVNNSGASAGLIAYLPFDGDYADRVGTTLTSAVAIGTPTYGTTAGLYKVGTSSIYFNNASPSGTPTQYLLYSVPSSITPLCVTFWFNGTAISGGAQRLFAFLSSLDNNAGFAVYLNSNTSINVQASYSSSPTNFGASYNATILTNTWYHVAVTTVPGSYVNLYVNGALASSTAVTTTGTFVTGVGGVALNCLSIGGMCNGTSSLGQAFQGYIDDFRIYSRPLTATQIAQLYANNASTTTASAYLAVPRSIVYPSPAIPAGTWAKLSFTLPADVTGTWFNADNGAGVLLSLCLGASGAFATANVAGVANNAATAWNALPEYTTTDVQVLGGSATNFLAAAGNSILVTGVQFEKGSIGSVFEARPLAVETMLSQRYFEIIPTIPGITYALIGYYRNPDYWNYLNYIVEKRSAPTFTAIGSWNGIPSITTTQKTATFYIGSGGFGLFNPSGNIAGYFNSEL